MIIYTILENNVTEIVKYLVEIQVQLSMCVSKNLCRKCYNLNKEPTINGVQLYCTHYKRYIKTLVLECKGYIHTEKQKRLG